MLFWILGTLLFITVTLWIIFIITDRYLVKEATFYVTLILICFVFFFTIGSIKRYWDYSVGFKKQYELLLFQENSGKLRKEAVLNEGFKTNESLNSPDNYSLKDREMLLNVISETRTIETIYKLLFLVGW